MFANFHHSIRSSPTSGWPQHHRYCLASKSRGGNPSRLKTVWDEHQSSQVKTEAEPVVELPIEMAEVVASISKALTERIAALAVELNDKAVTAAERKVLR